MTSKLTKQTQPTGTTDRFPDFPPRDDMQNFLHLSRPGHPGALDRHFGISNATAVLSEAPVRWEPSQQQGHRIPDLLVAFGVDRAAAVEQKGYSIREQGKPPDFVMEIASENTGQNDIKEKRDDYAGFGIPEYWRFDPSGGDYHGDPLAGDRLMDGVYQSIEINETDGQHQWGHSDVLNLDLCWEEGRLRWWDPVRRRYLETHDEEADARIAAEARAEAAEARANTEHEARIAAEARARELEEGLRSRRGPNAPSA